MCTMCQTNNERYDQERPVQNNYQTQTLGLIRRYAMPVCHSGLYPLIFLFSFFVSGLHSGHDSTLHVKTMIIGLAGFLHPILIFCSTAHTLKYFH